MAGYDAEYCATKHSRLGLRRRYVSNIGVKDERAVHHLGAELLGSQALVLPVCEKRLWRVP